MLNEVRRNMQASTVSMVTIDAIGWKTTFEGYSAGGHSDHIMAMRCVRRMRWKCAECADCAGNELGPTALDYAACADLR